MNSALKHISAILSEEGLTEKLPDSFKKVIAIELEELPDKTGYQFKRVTLDSFDAEGQDKYLFRKGGTSGTGVTLTCGLGKPNPKDKKQKTPSEYAATALNKKIIAYLRKMSAGAMTKEGQTFGRQTAQALEADQENVLLQITLLAEQIIADKKENAIVTLLISNGQARNYPRGIESLREYFHQLVNPETGEQDGKRSVGENAICSCCGKRSEKVYCRPPDLKLPYFTFDKPGFVSGGFFSDKEIQEYAWRNLPLCAECETSIRKGFKEVENKLSFELSRIKYLLIPNFTEWQSNDVQIVVRTLAKLGNPTDVNLQRDQEILFAHRLARSESTASFSFWFFRKKQSRLEILSTLENVLPSRLSEIATAIDLTEQHDLLVRFKVNQVTFGLLKDIFQPCLKKAKGDPPVNLFLKAVQRVVYGHLFDEREFFDVAMRYMREELREQLSKGKEQLTAATHKALAVAFWLIHLNLLRVAQSSDGTNNQLGDAMTDYPNLNANNLTERFDQFFQTFSGLFARDSQKACYLMGIWCAKVLDEQRRRHGKRQPFFRHLKELNLDEAEMQALVPKIKNKLREYDKDYIWWQLEKTIAEKFRNADSPWRLANSEISFFFTLGLCEASIFPWNSTTKEPSSEQEQ